MVVSLEKVGFGSDKPTTPVSASLMSALSTLDISALDGAGARALAGDSPAINVQDGMLQPSQGHALASADCAAVMSKAIGSSDILDATVKSEARAAGLALQHGIVGSKAKAADDSLMTAGQAVLVSLDSHGQLSDDAFARIKQAQFANSGS
jgi:hypothetical protein